ncbi:MAG: Gfo/Idh/MocA family oxidoreductase [Desulfurivibrionaceae bacterium]|nr:Gfo/Idh/MocA family oxidoreductase [Desulfurivibrionaceae bacterium]
MKKVRVGVIGVGYLGNFHAQKYAAMDHVDLVGIFDSDSDRARQIAAACGTRAFADYHDLIAQVDAVSIVTPTTFHHKVGMACLAAGLDVMMEKPITVTLAEADELIALAAQKGSILQVGHLERFNPGIMALEHYLDQPIYIESQRVHQFNPRGNDVDVVLDLMIHDIDIILSIVKSPLESMRTLGASVVTSSTDVATAQLIFENGCAATVTASRIAQSNIRQLVIHQKKSSLIVDYGQKDITVIERSGGQTAEGYPLEEATHLPFPGQGDALKTELLHFITAVQTRQQPKVSGVEGRQALAIALQLIAEIKAHQAVHQL